MVRGPLRAPTGAPANLELRFASIPLQVRSGCYQARATGRVWYGSQRPTDALAVWCFRGRSSNPRADEARPAPQTPRPAVSSAGCPAGKTARTGDPGGIVQQTLEQDGR